ncbi:hypothetical protein EDB86DRAFT_3194471 [Lactarius hatsudake]|nr:hypothetical protein EDB86DRAFT_3194471 [Lactarius hatsudake]
MVHNRQVLLIYPKMKLKHRHWEDHYYLPRIVRAVTGQVKAPFGDCVVSTIDTCISIELIKEATLKLGGVYLYANQQAAAAGCTTTGSQFSLTVVGIISATIDIEDVRAHRAKSRSMQAATAECYHRIEAPIALSGSKFDIIEELNQPTARLYEVRYHAPKEVQPHVLAVGLSLPLVHAGALAGALPPSQQWN